MYKGILCFIHFALLLSTDIAFFFYKSKKKRPSISKKLQPVLLWHSFDYNGLELGYILLGFPTSLPMFFSWYQILKKTWLFTKKEFEYLWRHITWKQLIFLWFFIPSQHEPTRKVLKDLVIHLSHLDTQFCQDSTYIYPGDHFSFLWIFPLTWHSNLLQVLIWSDDSLL